MLCRADIEAVLRTILDPEMPINIVDLGIVHAIRMQSPAGQPSAGTQDRSPALDGGQHPAGTGERTEVADGAGGAASPEEQPGSHVTVEITPTFVGCPALELLAREIRERVGGLPGVLGVSVDFVYSPPWSVDRISDAGREALRRHGVAVPEREGGGRFGGAAFSRPVAVTIAGRAAVPGVIRGPGEGGHEVACPFCGSRETSLESAFGPTRCRMIYYCPACRNSFEYLKDVRPA
jgi:ring-1,2-phenylacetyl-CoA epoxidase subunit PaaD